MAGGGSCGFGCGGGGGCGVGVCGSGCKEVGGFRWHPGLLTFLTPSVDDRSLLN